MYSTNFDAVHKNNPVAPANCPGTGTTLTKAVSSSNVCTTVSSIITGTITSTSRSQNAVWSTEEAAGWWNSRCHTGTRTLLCCKDFNTQQNHPLNNYFHHAYNNIITITRLREVHVQGATRYVNAHSDNKKKVIPWHDEEICIPSHAAIADKRSNQTCFFLLSILYCQHQSATPPCAPTTFLYTSGIHIHRIFIDNHTQTHPQLSLSSFWYTKIETYIQLMMIH